MCCSSANRRGSRVEEQARLAIQVKEKSPATKECRAQRRAVVYLGHERHPSVCFGPHAAGRARGGRYVSGTRRASTGAWRLVKNACARGDPLPGLVRRRQVQDTRERLESILRQRIAVLDGSWGVLLQREGRGRGGLPRPVVPRPRPRRRRRPRPAQPDAAGPDLPIHGEYFAAGPTSPRRTRSPRRPSARRLRLRRGDR